MQQEISFKISQPPMFVSAKTSSVAAEKDRPSSLRHVQLFDIPLCNGGLLTVLDWIKNRAKTKDKSIINFLNTLVFKIAFNDDNYRRCIKQSDRLLPDGRNVKPALRFQDIKLTKNITTSDVFPHLCRTSADAGLSIFLLGVEPENAETVVGKMHNRFPKLMIAGSHYGLSTVHKNDDIIKIINESGADILLISMDVPQQEIWLKENTLELHTSLNICVEGLFDFYSERAGRTPLWPRKDRLEWPWRLLYEPAHKWKR
jgi:N-acetylglucosaminyldiphosphoundecaprenol N-acetyl-beta-D-mannosaminyltransferase